MADPLEVGERGDIVDQIGPAAHDETAMLPLAVRPFGNPRFDNAGGQAVELGPVILDLGMDVVPQLAERAARQSRVQVIRGTAQVRLRHARRHLDDAVLDQPALGHHDGQRLPAVEAHELHLAAGHIGLGREHQPGAAAQARERLGGLGQHFLDRAPRGPALALDAGALVLGEPPELEQPVHIDPEPQLGRQPSCRDMGRIEQADILQVRHDVAHRGRRHRGREPARERARADRLPGLHEFLDQPAEYLPRAVGQFAQHRAILSLIGWPECSERPGKRQRRPRHPARYPAPHEARMRPGIVLGRRRLYDGGAKLLTDRLRRTAHMENARAAVARRHCRATAGASSDFAPRNHGTIPMRLPPTIEPTVPALKWSVARRDRHVPAGGPGWARRRIAFPRTRSPGAMPPARSRTEKTQEWPNVCSSMPATRKKRVWSWRTERA